MNKKCQQYILRTLYVALLLVGCVTAFSACSNNDDEILIDYYLHINSQEDISISSTDQEQGTMSAGSNVLARTIEDLRVAIRENYPVPTTQGDDSRVGPRAMISITLTRHSLVSWKRTRFVSPHCIASIELMELSVAAPA